MGDRGLALPRRSNRRAEQHVGATLRHTADPSKANRARHALDDLTERTGGLAYYPSTLEDIDAVALDVARQIRADYTIAYAPLNQALDGSYRTLRVTVSGPDRFVIRTRPATGAPLGLNWVFAAVAGDRKRSLQINEPRQR